jgi:fucose permease
MRPRTSILLLIFLIFFMISLMSNILGPIIPDLISGFSLSLGLAGFLPFSFFVAYGVMSLPAGLLVEKYREKRVLLWAFFLALVGAMTFALNPEFQFALISLFIIGIGMAMLQVVINPLLRVSGGEEHFAFNSVLGQLAFGAASFLSPLLYSYLVSNLFTGSDFFLFRILENWVPEALPWVSVYYLFAAIAVVMLLVISKVKFPQVELKSDEKVDIHRDLSLLVKQPTVWLFFMGIFCYVGTEQGIANWVSQFLQDYHGVDPATTGAQVISYFWGLLTVGCLLGLLLLKLMDSKQVLLIFSLGAMLALAYGLFGDGFGVLVAFALCGFFLSVMWSILISLALNSVKLGHGTLSGILCSGIVGGAIVPLIIGGLADLVGLKTAMFFLFLPLGYIFSVGIWARPLVANARVKSLKAVFSKE